MTIGGLVFFVLLLYFILKRKGEVKSLHWLINRCNAALIGYRYLHDYCSSRGNEKSTTLLNLLHFNEKIRTTCLYLTGVIILCLLPSYLALSQFYSIYSYKYAWNAGALFLSGSPSGIVLSIELGLFLALTCFIVSRYGPSEKFMIKDSIKVNSYQLRFQRIFLFFMIGFINLIVMILSDVLYVFIVIHYSTIIVIIAELALALMKIIWNNAIFWYLFNFLMKFDGEIVRKLNHVDLAFISLNINLNNIIYPIIAIMIISTNCFYNAFVSPETVTTTTTGQVPLLTTTFTVTFQTSYDPPFTYGYKCSSEIYAYYCPVFVLMLLFESIIIPLYHQSFLTFTSSENSNQGCEINDRTNNIRSSSSTSLLSFITYLNCQQYFKRENPVLFDKNLYIVRFTSSLLILLAYGAIFPPLAILVCIGTYLRTTYEEIRIGQILYQSYARNDKSKEIQLEEECKDLTIPVRYSLAIIIPISSFLFGYLIFDTFGKDVLVIEGWIAGIIFITFSLMVVIWTFGKARLKNRSKNSSLLPAAVSELVNLSRDSSPAVVINPLSE